MGGRDYTCCLFRFLLISAFLTPCHIPRPPTFFLHRSTLYLTCYSARSLEKVFLGQKEGIGSGTENPPEVQEVFLVMELGGQEGQTGPTELDRRGLAL